MRHLLKVAKQIFFGLQQWGDRLQGRCEPNSAETKGRGFLNAKAAGKAGNVIGEINHCFWATVFANRYLFKSSSYTLTEARR